MTGPRVLFVSKPIAPPWNDGSKNLVRDVAAHLRRARPTVMTLPGAPAIAENVTLDAVYTEPSRFAPAVAQNARVVRRLVLGDPLDLWHFVFAPNAVSSTVARVALRARRATGWRGAVVQTIPSAPRSFDGVQNALFGDAVVAVSEWMRGRLMGAGVTLPVRVIAPCAPAPRAPSDEAKRAIRAKLGIDERAPIVLYPGDYEVSRGAATVARAVPAITRAHPGAVVVYACRAKTSAVAKARAAIEDELRAAGVLDRTRHAGDVDDMHALIAASTVIAFPVDDLYGKVDVPLVLLEALALGVPLVVARGGPLETLTCARFVDPEDDARLAAEVSALLANERARKDAAELGRSLHAARFTPTAAARAYDDLYAELMAERAR